MTTDRELLELAAKAAGYEVRWHESWQCFVHVGPFNTTTPPMMAGQRHVWIPLDDDGDALRLAVKCELHLGVESHIVSAWHKNQFGRFCTEPLGDDRNADTRRAIVRAAAAIAKAGGAA